jgi:hypothetical protein
MENCLINTKTGSLFLYPEFIHHNCEQHEYDYNRIKGLCTDRKQDIQENISATLNKIFVHNLEGSELMEIFFTTSGCINSGHDIVSGLWTSSFSWIWSLHAL